MSITQLFFFDKIKIFRIIIRQKNKLAQIPETAAQAYFGAFQKNFLADRRASLLHFLYFFLTYYLMPQTLLMIKSLPDATAQSLQQLN
jgi:hypothetical protein